MTRAESIELAIRNVAKGLWPEHTIKDRLRDFVDFDNEWTKLGDGDYVVRDYVLVPRIRREFNRIVSN